MEKGRLIIDGVDVSGSVGSATSVPYSNTNSGLEATNTQGAIDELATSVTELNSNLNQDTTPTLLTTVTSFTHGEWKSISAFSDWKAYKELTFIGAGHFQSGDNTGAIATINTGLITSNMVINIIPYSNEEASNELKVKFLSTGKISVYVYETGTAGVDSLKIYGKV